MASFRFCVECNNMLYPKEDKPNSRLLYSCRNCEYTEVAEDARVYRNELQSALEETPGVTKDIGVDPTLPRSDRECPACHQHDCVFFQSQQRRAETTMILFYVCLHCQHTFRGTDHEGKAQPSAPPAVEDEAMQT